MNKPIEPVTASNDWRARLHEVIYEADTSAGKTFNIVLIASILVSILVVMLESVDSVRAETGNLLYATEWAFTLLFTLEYALRILSVKKPRSYIFSFFGVIDLSSILPTYLSIFLPGMQSLIIIRVFRLLRLFRVLKLTQYVFEAEILKRAMRASIPKIIVFLLTVISIVIITGAVMHIVEKDNPGFDTIPRSVYWAIVTLTTVGFGDIVPHTWLGQVMASLLMITGYGILAVPTGIVTVEISKASKISTQACPSCSRDGHDDDAVFCKYCGAKL